MSAPRSTWRRRLKKPAFALLAIALTLVFVEGLCSVGLFTYDLLFDARPSIRPGGHHTQYDETLGWVNEPGVFIEDMYAPGRSVTINGQGFRATRDYPRDVPDGRTRVLCTGDSFTLGYGVDDADTWCAQLERLAPGLETVNMGQGGYGFDQVYLWAERDAGVIDYDVHVCGVGVNEFNRMVSSRFIGYGKPTLRLDGDRLVADNVPVPRRAFFVPWLTRNADLLARSRIVEVVTRVFATAPPPAAEMSSDDAVRLALRGLEAMHIREAEAGRTFVVVWLPVLGECASNETDRFRDQLLGYLAARGARTVDLTPEFRALPAAQVSDLFIAEGAVDYPAAAGHYSVEGNRLVAERLVVHLRRLRALAPGPPAADAP